jgi:hypothetical protein
MMKYLQNYCPMTVFLLTDGGRHTIPVNEQRNHSFS